eukprot:scaffold856_cov326-Pavlova_lutheri.AAC.3
MSVAYSEPLAGKDSFASAPGKRRSLGRTDRKLPPRSLNSPIPIKASTMASSFLKSLKISFPNGFVPFSHHCCTFLEVCPATTDAAATPAAPAQGPTTGVAQDTRIAIPATCASARLEE